VDASGRAVPGATMRVDGQPPLWRDVTFPATNATGEFTLDCAPASGLVPLVVTAPGFLDTHALVTVPSAMPKAVDLFRGGLVWGEVVDTSGVIVPDAELRFAPERGGPSASSADSHALFGVRLRAGRYAVSAGANVPETIDVAEGGDVHLRVVVPIR
jgi:hypothetical protein